MAIVALGITFALFGAVAASTGISRRCPVPDVCFGLSIPTSSVQSSTGALYLHVTGPTSYSWIAVAQGEQMEGAHYFIIYVSEDGRNVTVSPRLADGHSKPYHTPDTVVEIMEGSGVKDGMMTANIKCSNCSSWTGGSMDLTAETTEWIWGFRAGNALNTNDPTVAIGMHDSFGSVTFDTQAKRGADTNPFTAPASPNPTNPSSSGGHTTTSHGPPARVVRMYTAHAILASLAWAFIFPLGGIMIRLLSFKNLLWTHAYLQLLGFAMYIAAVGLGVQLSINPRYWRMDNKHVIIGLAILGLFLLQGFTGYIHHVLFVRKRCRTWVSYAHLWSGRVGITLGMMNAGFGFQITRKGWETWEVKLYTVCALLVWCVYVASVVLGEMKRRAMVAGREAEECDVQPEVMQSGTSSGTQTPRKVEDEGKV